MKERYGTLGNRLPKGFSFSKFPNTLFFQKNPQKSADGKIRYLNEVEVGLTTALKTTIVVNKGYPDDVWMKNYNRTEVMAELCEFLPSTEIVVNKQNFYVANHDADPNDPKSKEGVLHNPHGFDVLGARSMTLFNIRSSSEGFINGKGVKDVNGSKKVCDEAPCDQHEFMQS